MCNSTRFEKEIRTPKHYITQREKPQKVDARAFLLVARRRTRKERQEECSSRLRQLSSAPSSACVRRCTRALCGKCLCFTVRFSFSSSSSSSSFVGEMNPALLCFRCLSLSAHGADDTSRPNTKNATPNNRTAAPRWIRRRRRVDRGMVGPKRAEFAEGCRRFGRRATGEERRFRLFLFFFLRGFEIRL